MCALRSVCIMYVSRISSNYAVAPAIQHKKSLNHQINIKGKHECAKTFGGICAGLGTLGAFGGIALMTGGVSLIPTLIYGAVCGGIGAAGGHIIDKAQPDYNKKK